jgi:hypothetical protein
MKETTNKTSIVDGDLIGIEFTPQVFPTHALAVHLYTMMNDYVKDPEPQHNTLGEALTTEECEELISALTVAITAFGKYHNEKNSDED